MVNILYICAELRKIIPTQLLCASICFFITIKNKKHGHITYSKRQRFDAFFQKQRGLKRSQNAFLQVFKTR